jgi:hypothetical protein
VDFEFTNLGRDNLIVISGAIMGRHQPGMITKLEGRALVLNTDRPVTNREWKTMVHHLVKIFKTKPRILFPVLAQVTIPGTSQHSNLNSETIRDYLVKYDRIILWEGSTDRKILDGVKVDSISLSMRGWDRDMNGEFYLQILNKQKIIIASVYIGKFIKQGRALKLTEAHDLVCGGGHGAAEPHDPVTDVLYTNCLFLHLRSTHGTIIDEEIC